MGEWVYCIRRILLTEYCRLQVSVCNIYVFHTPHRIEYVLSQSNRTDFNDKLGMLSFEMRINRTFGEWKFESDTNDTVHITNNVMCVDYVQILWK